MLYDCGHEGTHILILSCESGFDWPSARCNLQHENVVGWYERHERCPECRNRNRPRVERRHSQSHKATGSRSPETMSPLNHRESSDSRDVRSGSGRQTVHVNCQDSRTLVRPEKCETASQCSGSTRNSKYKEHRVSNDASESRTGKCSSTSSDKYARFLALTDEDTETLLPHNQRASASESKLQRTVSHLLCKGKGSDRESTLYRKTSLHREDSYRRLPRRSGAEKHNRAWEQMARDRV